MSQDGGNTSAAPCPISLTREEVRALLEELSDLWIRTAHYSLIRSVLAKLETADAAAAKG